MPSGLGGRLGGRLDGRLGGSRARIAFPAPRIGVFGPCTTCLDQCRVGHRRGGAGAGRIARRRRRGGIERGSAPSGSSRRVSRKRRRKQSALTQAPIQAPTQAPGIGHAHSPAHQRLAPGIAPGEGGLVAAAPAIAVEMVRPDRADMIERLGPVGVDEQRVVVRRMADRRIDRAAQRLVGDALGRLPAWPARRSRKAAVAGEGELAPGAPLRPLIDHPAHTARPGGMRHAVEHDLRDRALARLALACRLVPDRLGEAAMRAGVIDPESCGNERARRRPHRDQRADIAPASRNAPGERVRARQGDKRFHRRISEIVERRAGKTCPGLLERHQRRALGSAVAGRGIFGRSAQRERAEIARRCQNGHRDRRDQHRDARDQRAHGAGGFGAGCGSGLGECLGASGVWCSLALRAIPHGRVAEAASGADRGGLAQTCGRERGGELAGHRTAAAMPDRALVRARWGMRPESAHLVRRV